jgi:FkbM family methyltransferase
MKAIKALIAPGDEVVEVGGHIGYISLWFAECVGDKGHVIVFEPGSNNLPYIRSNIKDVSQVRLIEKGCGPEASELEFFEDSLTGQNNSFVSSFQGLKSNIEAASNIHVEITKRKVDVVRLDTELPDIVPNFVKIDVEGFELPVLLGTEGWFNKNEKVPIIMIEIQSDQEEIFAWMRQRNYTLFDIHGCEIKSIPRETQNFFALNIHQHADALTRWLSEKN